LFSPRAGVCSERVQIVNSTLYPSFPSPPQPNTRYHVSRYTCDAYLHIIRKRRVTTEKIAIETVTALYTYNIVILCRKHGISKLNRGVYLYIHLYARVRCILYLISNVFIYIICVYVWWKSLGSWESFGARSRDNMCVTNTAGRRMRVGYLRGFHNESYIVLPSYYIIYTDLCNITKKIKTALCHCYYYHTLSIE